MQCLVPRQPLTVALMCTAQLNARLQRLRELVLSPAGAAANCAAALKREDVVAIASGTVCCVLLPLSVAPSSLPLRCPHSWSCGCYVCGGW